MRDMRKTRNVTLAVSEEGYRKARRWAAHYDFSLSGALGFLLENLPDIAAAVRKLRQEDPTWSNDSARWKR